MFCTASRFAAGAVFALCLFSGGVPVSAANAVEATISGLTVRIDADSGSILQMSYPDAGTMLEAVPKDTEVAMYEITPR